MRSAVQKADWLGRRCLWKSIEEDLVRKNSELNRIRFLTLRRRHSLRNRGKSSFTARFLVLVEITWMAFVAIGICLVDRRGRRTPGAVALGHLSNRPSIERLLPHFGEFPPSILRPVVAIYVCVGFAIGSCQHVACMGKGEPTRAIIAVHRHGHLELLCPSLNIGKNGSQDLYTLLGNRVASSCTTSKPGVLMRALGP